jgi:nitroimidazol reductase NimA-like FMN-containing flavoprotein (pyridoxamine 5'-phosphate oxidase superfamily)
MQIRELSTEQCFELLTRTTLGHLACAVGKQPYVVPIHFSCDAERNCLYGFSAVGQKIAWMRENPLVCVEIADIADKNRWTTVLVFGRYEEIQDSPEYAETRQRVWDRFQARREWWLPAAAKLGTRESPAVVIYQIRIDRLTGRSASRDSS